MSVKKGIVVVSLLFMTLLLSCRGSSGKENEVQSQVRVVPVVVQRPQYGPIERTLILTGRIKGIREVDVYPDLPGKFQRFGVREGQEVRKGEPILWILRDVPGLTYPPVPVKAPASGIVTLRPLEEGETILPQTRVATILGIDTVRVIFHLPERYAYSVKVGDRVKIKTPSRGWREGKIIWEASLLDPLTHTREVHAMLMNRDRKVLPGGMTEVKIPVERKERALVVPSVAILREVTPFVFVVESGVAKKRPVRLGITDFSMTEIEGGLSPEDWVVVKGQTLLQDGQKVEVVSSREERKG